jgi:flagellar motor switch protein FliG
LDVVQDEILADVERTLQEELSGSLAAGPGRDAHATMATIFNQLDRTTETRLMRSLEDVDKEAADRIRALMFTFEDLSRIDAAGIQMLIRSAGNDRLPRALKGAGEPLRALFLANMSERSAKMLREEMQGMGPVRLKDVEEAQQFMVNMAKELAASGQITLTQGEEEELIY